MSATKYLSLMVAAIVGSTAICQRTMADTIAYDNSSSTTPNQKWTGNLGLDFDVNSPINVTALGAFFGNSINNLVPAVKVAIFSRATGLEVGSAVTISSTIYDSLSNGDAFVSLAIPIFLAPGAYSVVENLDPTSNQDYNVHITGGTSNTTSTEDNGGGAITFKGTGRYDYGSSLDLPKLIGDSANPTNAYDSGTFQFASVPLPSAALGGVGLMGCLLAINVIRRRNMPQ